MQPRSVRSAVAHHLADQPRASPDGGQGTKPTPPDNFLYVFKPGPTGPGSAPPPKDGRLSPSAPASLPLQAAALGLARTCQQSAGSHTAARVHQTLDALSM